MTWDLRLGRWQDALADVGEVDCVITDPPYGARTHAGQRHRRNDGADTIATVDKECHPIPYEGWTTRHVRAFVKSWSPRCLGWFCAMTSHDLVPSWIDAMEKAGRYAFAPIACVQTGMNIRLAGDGPSNWAVWMIVSRPRTMRAWGTLSGAYVVGQDQDRKRGDGVIGGKPTGLMRAIIRDYSRPGDLVCDPTAGAGTTGVAALTEGRRFIGAEMDPVTHAKAMARLQRGYTPPLFVDGPKAEQLKLT